MVDILRTHRPPPRRVPFTVHIRQVNGQTEVRAQNHLRFISETPPVFWTNWRRQAKRAGKSPEQNRLTSQASDSALGSLSGIRDLKAVCVNALEKEGQEDQRAGRPPRAAGHPEACRSPSTGGGPSSLAPPHHLLCCHCPCVAQGTWMGGSGPQVTWSGGCSTQPGVLYQAHGFRVTYGIQGHLGRLP